MRRLTPTAWAIITTIFGWVAFASTLSCWGYENTESQVTIPVPTQPGWYTARGPGLNTYDVYISREGVGTIRNQMTGIVTTFDTTTGMWRDSNLNTGMFK